MQTTSSVIEVESTPGKSDSTMYVSRAPMVGSTYTSSTRPTLE